MAILLTKLEKGLSGIRALNLVIISKRCITLLNWTNQTKNTGRDRLGFWSPHWWFQIPGNGFRIPVVECQGQGFPIPRKKIPEFQIPQAKVSRILKSGLPLGDQALFSSYVLFSQRSKGNLTLCLFLCADHVSTWIRCKLKETVLESIYTWPALENKTYKLKRSIVTYHLDTQQWPAFRCRKLKISLKITYIIQNNQASMIKCNCLMLCPIIIFSMKNVHLKRVLFLGI